MDSISAGCRLCLDPFAESYTTLDSPELKNQMEKVFCFPIEPKQGYCCGVCQSCSYAISEFYQYSEKVRQNQELLNGTVANCDPTIDSKLTLEIVKVETLSDALLPEMTIDDCEPNDAVSGEEVPSVDPTHEIVKVETLSDSVLPEMTVDDCEPNDEVSGKEVPSVDPTHEIVKVETLSDSVLPEMTVDDCEPNDEVSGEEVSTVDSKIMLVSVKVETLSDAELPETTEDACELEDEVSGEEEAPSSEDDESYEPTSRKSQSKPKGRLSKRKLDDLKAEEPTENFKKSAGKTQKQLNEQDQLFNKHFRMICDLCGKSATTFTELVNHFRKDHKRRNGYLVCCNKKLFYRCAIIDHIDFHANPDVFRCEECGIKYKNKVNLKEHMLFKHPSAGPIKCDLCPQSFAQKSALAQHMKLHVKFKCPKCNKVLATKRSLGDHMINQHSDEKRRKVCDVCGKKFVSRSCFNRHKNEHKGIVQRFQCGICQRWLKGADNLRNHMNTVHGNRDREFQCDICLQKYLHPRSLRQHKQFQHAEPKLECEFCGMKFNKSDALKEHRATHTGEVLYTCEYCGIPKNVRWRLYHHIKRQHPTEWAQKKLKAKNRPE